MSLVIVHGTIDIQEQHLDEAIHLSLDHVNRSRKEPGCISHNVHIDLENKRRLVFYEQWQSLEALHVHFEVAESGQFVKQIGKLASGKPCMAVFESRKIR